MSDWPPKPENQIQNTQQPVQPTGSRMETAGKAVLASVEEQRRARRWGSSLNFNLAYLLVVILALGKGCSMSASDPSAGAGAHIAVVDIIGTIAADKQSVNSSNTIKSLKKP